jgi:hypothetical protein
MRVKNNNKQTNKLKSVIKTLINYSFAVQYVIVHTKSKIFIFNLLLLPEFYISDEEVSYDSSGKILLSDGFTDAVVAGSDLAVTCSARTPGVTNPSFTWTQNGRPLPNPLPGRYSVVGPTLVDPATDFYRFKSVLTIQRILLAEEGRD